MFAAEHERRKDGSTTRNFVGLLYQYIRRHVWFLINSRDAGATFADLGSNERASR